MSDKKLNKNQLAFFESAVEHFGNESTQARFQDLKHFAEINGLTVPISFLKNHCLTGVRGIYDITQSGIEVSKNTGLFALTDNVPVEEDSEDPIEDVFEFKDDKVADIDPESTFVIEPPAYVPSPTVNNQPDFFSKRDRINRKFKNPIYLVQYTDGYTASVCGTPNKAYEKANKILHGTYSLNEKQALKALEDHGVVIITCLTATSLKAVIIKMELNE